MIMTERELQTEVIRIAKAYNWEVYFTFDSRLSPRGFPDLVLVRERVIFAELKTETGRLSKEQIKWRKKLLEANAEYYLWREEDLLDITMTLGKRG